VLKAGDFVEFQDHGPLRDLPRFTLAAWIKAVPEPRFRGIVGKIHSQEPRPGSLLSLNAEGQLRCDAVDNHFENRHFNGLIDEIAIFARPLTVRELDALMNLTAEQCAP